MRPGTTWGVGRTRRTRCPVRFSGDDRGRGSTSGGSDAGRSRRSSRRERYRPQTEGSRQKDGRFSAIFWGCDFWLEGVSAVAFARVESAQVSGGSASRYASPDTNPTKPTVEPTTGNPTQTRQRRHGMSGQCTDASRATAKRDLEDLVAKSLFVLVGTGRTAHYLVAGKRPRNGSIGSRPRKLGLADQRASQVHL